MVIEFTREQKLAEVAREIALRRNVYKKRIKDGLMSAKEAEQRIAVMVAIARDYGGGGPQLVDNGDLK